MQRQARHSRCALAAACLAVLLAGAAAAADSRVRGGAGTGPHRAHRRRRSAAHACHRRAPARRRSTNRDPPDLVPSCPPAAPLPPPCHSTAPSHRPPSSQPPPPPPTRQVERLQALEAAAKDGLILFDEGMFNEFALSADRPYHLVVFGSARKFMDSPKLQLGKLKAEFTYAAKARGGAVGVAGRSQCHIRGGSGTGAALPAAEPAAGAASLAGLAPGRPGAHLQMGSGPDPHETNTSALRPQPPVPPMLPPSPPRRAQAFKSGPDGSKVFFIDMWHEDAAPVFARLGLNSLPIIIHWGPNQGGKAGKKLALPEAARVRAAGQGRAPGWGAEPAGGAITRSGRSERRTRLRPPPGAIQATPFP